jgi:hypothetical protein
LMLRSFAPAPASDARGPNHGHEGRGSVGLCVRRIAQVPVHASPEHSSDIKQLPRPASARTAPSRPAA